MKAYRKKILCFSHLCTPKFITGAEKNFLFFVREIRAWTDAVLVVPNEGMLSAEARKSGVPVIVGNFPPVPRFLWPKASFREELALIESSPSLKDVENVLLREKADLVITNTTIHPIPAIVARKLGIPVAWWIREMIPSKPYYQEVIPFIERHADWIPGSSNAVLRRFSEEKKILIYPSWRSEEHSPESWGAYRDELRRKLGIDESSLLVGTVAAYILPDKGLEHFVKMALRLCERYDRVRFLSVGSKISPEYFEKCLNLVKSSNYADRFRFLDFTKEIERIYPALDIVVIPSLIEEGFGTTALEGLWFGKPVIAYASGGLKETLGATPYPELLVEKGNLAELQRQASRLIEDKSFRTKAGKGNLEAANRTFGIKSYRRAVKTLLKRMGCFSD